jgi:hypothetical protein
MLSLLGKIHTGLTLQASLLISKMVQPLLLSLRKIHTRMNPQANLLFQPHKLASILLQPLKLTPVMI